jgi:hypothetical protein
VVFRTLAHVGAIGQKTLLGLTDYPLRFLRSVTPYLPETTGWVLRANAGPKAASSSSTLPGSAVIGERHLLGWARSYWGG